MRKLLPFLLLSLPGSAAAEPLRLTVEEAVQRAIASGPGIAAARSHAAAADNLQKSARGRFFPALVVTDEYQHWDKPFEVAFALPGVPAGGPGLQARDRDTNTFTVSVSQPVVGLLKRGQDYEQRASSSEAARAGVEISLAATREAVETEYLQLFQAKARVAVARSSEEELAQQVSETSANVRAGTLTSADLSRVAVALSTARQSELVANAAVTVARANLLSMMGLPPDDTAVEFAEPESLLGKAAPEPASPTQISERRPELQRARLQAEAAQHEARARSYALLPEVDVEAAYSRVDGQAFAPKNAAFVGVRVAWPIWEWGASDHLRRAAAAEAEAAAWDVEGERRRVLTEVTARNAELGAATSAIALAREALASAQDAYNVTAALVRAGTGTTTDLLSAQAALNEARLSVESARYAQAMSRVALERATGSR
jgi:outer membrane protein TolC